MNMPKRYSEMTPYELREEIGVLKEQAIKAEQLGIVNEFDVLMRKIAMARAYMTDINKFHIGETYELVEELVYYLKLRISMGYLLGDISKMIMKRSEYRFLYYKKNENQRANISLVFIFSRRYRR